MATTLNLVTQLATAEFWYVHSEGATFGPFTPGQMDELGNQGRLGPQSMVVPAGDTNWVSLGSLLPALKNTRTPTSAELSTLVGVAPRSPLGEPEATESPMTFDSLVNFMPKTAAQRLGPENVVGCAICLSPPMQPFVFKQVIGMVYFRRVKTLTGGYCRPCAQATGRKIQSLTILTGWWGIISIITNFGVIVANAMALWDARKMDSPRGGDNPKRLSSGLPVIVRPATLAFFALAALLYFAKIRAGGEP
jgi:GYF domain 2